MAKNRISRNPIKNNMIRNLPLSSRLLYSFILMAILPLIISAGISYYVSNNAIENKVSDYSVQTMKAVNQLIDYECNKYERVADLILINKQVQKGMKQFGKMNYIQKNEFVTEMNQVMSNYMSNQPDIMQIYLIDVDHTPIYDQGWFYFSPDKLKEIIEKSKYGKNWLSITEAKMNYVIYTKPITDRNRENIIGYISIHINPDAFNNCFSNMNLGEDSNLTILDAEGNIIQTQETDAKIGNPLDMNLFSLCQQKRKKPIISNYKISNKKSIVIYAHVKEQNFTTMLIISNKYLRSVNKPITIATLICIISGIFCAIVVYRQMWKSIKIPLEGLVEAVGKAADNNFNQFIVDDSKDELGYLGRTFSQVTKKMQELIIDNKKEQGKKRELELNMLQAQINPHFLFNTLNSLRWTAMMSGAGNVSNGLAALSTLLSNTIIDKHQFITVEKEIENVKSYIEIQKIRYGDIFTVDYEIEEELYQSYVIKFLLQPIVENAIIHGMNEAVTTNNIIIKMKRIGENIQLIIQDNGKGFDVEELEKKENKKSFSGFAIYNIKERIKLCFGKDYLFEIESKIGEGTTVRIEFPYLTENIEEEKTGE